MTNENTAMTTNETMPMEAKPYKKDLLTLIIYIPGEEGWHDRCGDYHSGKESSFEMEYFESEQDNSHEEKIGKRMGKFKFENEDVQFKLLFNGIEPYNEPEYFCEDNAEEAERIQGSWDYMDSVAYSHMQNLQQEENRRKEEAKRVKEAEELARRLREKHAQEEREKAEFLRLKAKYGN